MLSARHFFLFSYLNEIEFPLQIFEKYSNIKFNENPSSESQFAPCGRTDGQSDTRKLRAALYNFVNAPKNACISKMKKQLILYSEFADKIDREISV